MSRNFHDEANRRSFDYPRDQMHRVVPDMIEEAARDVAGELEQDSDPVALQRKTARLALLLAWHATESWVHP